MNTFRFEAEIVRAEGGPAEVVRERVYGRVRVSAEWPEDLSTPELRVALQVAGDVDVRNAPAYVELFFHDLFLMLNLSSPGSFGGTISITGGELRARELELNPRVFEYAAPLESVPLANVVAWYESLGIGTQQIAKNGVGTALFELLHLARGDEEEERSILRLARAAEGLVGPAKSPRKLFEMREAIARGRTPVFHPMFDDGLDPQVEDATREWVDVADAAASAVIAALQERARNALSFAG